MATDLSICGPAIEAECKHWESTKEPLESTRAAVSSLRLNRIEAGIFQLVVGPNNDVCTKLEEELGRASTEATAIANALQRSLAAYRKHEAETSEIIDNTFS